MNAARPWYKEAIVYELRIRSFYDKNGDGVGDIPGLIDKLDYLQDLGVTALWLLPFYPSPLKDDGYDIADYFGVHRSVGTLADFRKLVAAAHARGLRVITELVLNHTSDAHPWFQRARRAARGSRERDYYVWSDDPGQWSAARVIFQDFESSNWSWDPVANAYYWHRFFAHQPDLNFEHPDVRTAMLGVLDHWFELGVDGLRLDAVPYLFEREGTTCENLPETHAFLKELRAHVDAKFPDRMLLAEANQWPEDAAAYFGDADECHMAFHFPIMPRLFMALRMEDSYPIADILEQTPAIPDACQWAIFLRNHDELTLEMVTEEERDYMVERFAHDRQTRINLGIRRRLAPLLDNDRRSLELLNALLLSLPGTPVIYYGDEIGMGDNAYLGDRNGVRTPMQWSPDRNGGFSQANPQRLILPTILDPEYAYQTVNVEVQQQNSSSLLWWMKRALALRRQHPTFACGKLRLLAPENRKVLAFISQSDDETLLVVANLSRSSQWVELELAEFQAVRPLELFGKVEFPPIEAVPYRLTLGGHGVFWFSLSGVAYPRVPEQLPVPWRALVLNAQASSPLGLDSALEAALVAYLPTRRWFRSKHRRPIAVTTLDTVALGKPKAPSLVFVEVSFEEGEPELYLLAVGEEASATEPAHAIVGLGSDGGDASLRWVVDLSEDPSVADALHELALGEGRLHGARVELSGVRFSRPDAPSGPAASTRALGGEQSNSAFRVQNKVAGKLARKLEEGTSLESDVLEHLGRAPNPPRVPALVARVDADLGRGAPATIWLSESYIQNEGDAWGLTIDAVQRCFERVLTTHGDRTPDLPPADRRAESVPPLVSELLGEHLSLVELLGQRTAELHSALAFDKGHSSFRPRSPTALSQRSFYQSLRNLASRSLDLLGRASLAPPARALANELLERRPALRRRFERLLQGTLTGKLIRIHGDFHLGQVLYTGKDLCVVDFDGEPARSRGERERLRSPLVDVAGMMRSFHYAAYGTLSGELTGSQVRAQDRPTLVPWAAFHERWSSTAFFSAYLRAMSASDLLPNTPKELASELELYLLEKALYEIVYELGTRPHWVELPLRGALDALGS